MSVLAKPAKSAGTAAAAMAAPASRTVPGVRKQPPDIASTGGSSKSSVSLASSRKSSIASSRSSVAVPDRVVTGKADRPTGAAAVKAQRLTTEAAPGRGGGSVVRAASTRAATAAGAAKAAPKPAAGDRRPSTDAAARRESFSASLASGRSTPSASASASASVAVAAAASAAATAAALSSALESRAERDAALAESRRLAVAVQALAVVCGYAATVDGFEAPRLRRNIDGMRRRLEVERRALAERAKTELTAARALHAEQLSALAVQHQATLEQQQSLHCLEMKSLEEQDAKAMQDSERRHSSKLDDLAGRYEAAIAELQTQLSMAQFECAALGEKVAAAEAKIEELTARPPQKELASVASNTESHLLDFSSHSNQSGSHLKNLESHPKDLVSHSNNSESHSNISESHLKDSESHPIELESHPIELESHPMELESHPIELESHPKELESQPMELESHPIGPESHSNNSESHRNDSESHPKDSESHLKDSESHPKDSESHPKDSEPHPEHSDVQVNNSESPALQQQSQTEAPDSAIQLRRGGSGARKQQSFRASSIIDGDERPIAPLVQMQSPPMPSAAEMAELQAALASYRHLPDEIASLKSVLELRTREVSEQRRQRMEAEERLAGVKEMRERAVQMQCKLENLEAILAMKTENEKLLHEKHQLLLRKFDQEYKAKSRLSMNYEELKFKLEALEQNCMSQSMASFSLSATPPLSSNTQPQPPPMPMSSVMTRSMYSRGLRHDRDKRKTIATAATAWHSGDGAG